MVRYDLPTYVIYVLEHFWMFAVKITECVFSLKSLGLYMGIKTYQEKNEKPMGKELAQSDIPVKRKIKKTI